MGKSRLLGEAATMAHGLSFKVGHAEVEPGDSVVELAALMEALFDGADPVLVRDRLREVQALPERRYWLLQDIQALLERVALDSPVLVCLDDLQWTDNGTAAALRALTTRLATVPICWALAFRPGQGSHQVLTMIEILERGEAERIVLGPLDQPAVAQLAADVLLAEPDEALLQMAERARGSPFLLVELLAGLGEEQLVHVESGRAALVEDRLPRRVHESMRRRLERMSEPARQVATVAAALGRRFSLSGVAAMLDLSPAALLAPVEELIHAGLLVESDNYLAFGHDLTREAVRSSLPVTVRRALDRQAATMLLAGGALPVEVAAQLAASAEPGDEVAIATLLKAAEALGTTDPKAAADLSQRALEIAPPQHPLRGQLVAQTAIFLSGSLHSEQAKQFAETELSRTLPPAQEAEVMLSIADISGISADERSDAARRGLAIPGLSMDLRARLLARIALNLLVAGRISETRSVLPETRAAVQASGHPAATFQLNLAECGLEYLDGRFTRSLEIIEGTIRLGLTPGADTDLGLARQWRAVILSELDRFDESVQLTEAAIADSLLNRQGVSLQRWANWRGRQLFQMGRLADAAAALEGSLNSDDPDFVLGLQEAATVVTLGRIALHTGEKHLMRQTGDVAQAMLDQGLPGVRRHAAWLLALRSMSEGNATEARASLCALGDAERKSILPLFPMELTDEVHLVRIAVATEDHELAEAAVTAAERRSELNPDVISIAATAAHASGLFTGHHKDLSRAVELFGAGSRPLALASALEDLGAAKVKGDSPEQGVDPFDRALALYSQAGATWDAGRLRNRLRALGVRRRLISPQRPQRGWAAMTDSELTVARLVAQGLTNREVAEHLFVSPHTVSGHLRHIFEKLDVNSRVALTRLVGDEDARL
jgi:DNA-binding CsgD family transcriptional regulator/tetratricopeptide (TPR) repeat protein